MRKLLSHIWDIRFVLLLALAVWFAKVLFIVTTPGRGLAMTTWIIDDAFGEMAIARNIAMGHGFTYDFVHLTTGAPLLWTYMLSVPFRFLSLMGGVKANIVMSSFFGMLATVVVFLLAKRVTANRTTAWIAFILATFTANAFFEAMNGMETAMFTFVVLGAFAAYMGVGVPQKLNQKANAFSRGCIIGAWTGLGYLIRGDDLFVIGALGLMLLIDLWLEKNDLKSRMQTLLGYILFVAIGMGIVTSWQMYSMGTPTLANQIGRHEIALAWHNFSFAHFELLKYIRIVLWNVFALEHLYGVAMGASLLGLLGLAYAWTQTSSKKFAAATFFYVLSFGAALTMYQWYFPDMHGLRYIDPAVHLFCIAIAMLITLVCQGRFRAWLMAGCTLAVIILTGYRFYDVVIHMAYAPWNSLIARPTPEQEKAFLGMYDWMRENLPKDAVIGIRDHGRPAIFSERAIQDISGNMDPHVPLVLHEENGPLKLREYLRERHVTYMLIPAPGARNEQLYKILHEILPLTVVKGTPPSTAPLYKIQWERVPKP